MLATPLRDLSRLGTAHIAENRQAVRVPRGGEVAAGTGGPAELVCWGIMPSGMLRHPLLLRWL